MFSGPFSSRSPFAQHSDRCPREWLKVHPVFQEPGSGYRHIRKTNSATGQGWMCIESPGGRLLAEFPLGMPYPSVTLIRRESDEGRELGRDTYGLGQGNEPSERIELAALRSMIESGRQSGTIVLLSGEDAVVSVARGGAKVVREWQTVWAKDGRPLGKSAATAEYSPAGGLMSRHVGDRTTHFDAAAPVAAPLSTMDQRTGKRDETYSVDLIDNVGRKTRIVDEGRPVGWWHKLRFFFLRRR